MAAANDGNLSVRLPDGSVLATPTGVSKGFMRPERMVHLSADGKCLSEGRPSSEIKMHLACYKVRPDIHAIVHAHPVFATVFAASGIPLDKPFLAETVLFLGAVPVAPYAMPSTDAVPESVRAFAEKGDAVLLANHGALTLGQDIETAYFRMETLEHTAQIVFYIRQMGHGKILSAKQIEDLADLREKMRIPGRVDLSGFKGTE